MLTALKFFWLGQCRKLTFEQVGNGGGYRFHHMDAALATALIKTVPQQLRIRIQKEEDKLMENLCVIKGR